MEALILEELGKGRVMTSTEMSKATGYAVNSISSKLSKMVRAGQIQEDTVGTDDGYTIHSYFILEAT